MAAESLTLTRDLCPCCGEQHAADEGITLYHRHFTCSECGTEWDDVWCCDCNDKCPACNAEIESDPDSVEEEVIEEAA